MYACSNSSIILQNKKAKTFFENSNTKELVGHRKSCISVSWNVFGNRLATASHDTTAKIWAIDTKKDQGLHLLELRGHTAPVEVVSWNIATNSNNSDQIATASIDKYVKLWDARVGKSTHSINTNGENITLCWSNDGHYIAVANKRNVVSIIDNRMGSISRSCSFPVDINEMAWSHGAEALVLTTSHGTIDIYKNPIYSPNVVSKEVASSYNESEKDKKSNLNNSWLKLSSHQCHVGPVFCLEFSPDGKYLLTGGVDAIVCLWDLSTFSCIRSFSRYESPIRSISFTHDSQYFVAATSDKFFDVWCVSSGELVHTIDLSADPLCCAFAPNHGYNFNNNNSTSQSNLSNILNTPSSSHNNSNNNESNKKHSSNNSNNPPRELSPYILAFATDDQEKHKLGNVSVLGY